MDRRHALKFSACVLVILFLVNFVVFTFQHEIKIREMRYLNRIYFSDNVGPVSIYNGSSLLDILSLTPSMEVDFYYSDLHFYFDRDTAHGLIVDFNNDSVVFDGVWQRGIGDTFVQWYMERNTGSVNITFALGPNFDKFFFESFIVVLPLRMMQSLFIVVWVSMVLFLIREMKMEAV